MNIARRYADLGAGLIFAVIDRVEEAGGDESDVLDALDTWRRYIPDSQRRSSAIRSHARRHPSARWIGPDPADPGPDPADANPAAARPATTTRSAAP